MYTFFVAFGPIQTMCSGITSGGACRTILSAEDRIQVSQVQDKHLTCCTNSLAPLKLITYNLLYKHRNL